MNRKLRVGILVNSCRIPAWAHAMLQRIVAGDYAEIVLVVRDASPRGSAPGVAERIRRNAPNVLFTAFSRIESRLSHPRPDAFASVDCSELLAGVPCVDVIPVRGKFSDTITDSDLATIATHDLDVLVRLGFRILRGGILRAARYGVWSYHHGDNSINRGGPPGVWEVLERWDVTGSILQILSEDLDNGLVMARSHAHTDRMFTARNRNGYYWKSMSFLPRALQQLHQMGGDAFTGRLARVNQHPAFYSRRLFTTPTNREMLRLGIAHSWKALKRKMAALLHFEQWMLLYALRSDGTMATSFWRFKPLVPPKDRFWADPFVVAHADTWCLFIEEFVYARGKGHIAAMTVDANGVVGPPRTVLQCPYHLSYPFVFEYNGEHFMVPESAANRTVDVYRCTNFPDTWEHAATLMRDVHAVDATLLEHGGRWWMFVNIRENPGASALDELFLFHADTPLSANWVPHPCNPIVSDVRSARPAGRVFEHNGNLYRPSQNSARRYGHSMAINQIVTLTTEAYEERLVETIKPEWAPGIVGTHTLNHAAGLTVIDALKRRRKYFGG